MNLITDLRNLINKSNKINKTCISTVRWDWFVRTVTCFLLLRFRCGQPCCKGTFSVGIQRCKWPSKHYSCWPRNNNLCHGKISVAWDTNKFRIARRFPNFPYFGAPVHLSFHFELDELKNPSPLFHLIESKQVSTSCPLKWGFPLGRQRPVTLTLLRTSAGGSPAVV